MWRTGILSYYIRMENIFRKEVKTIMSGITSIVVGILMFCILFISPTQLKVALLHLVNCKLFYIWHKGGVMSGIIL